jgi:uncharacterized membrane protein YccF (DUF307 family)
VAGWLLFAFVLTFVLLRATAASEARVVVGAAFMGFGILLIWQATVQHAAHHHMPDMIVLFAGLWLVVAGALRFASY